MAEERVILELKGSEADRGVRLYTLESFIDSLLRGLRAFDRSTRLEMGRKAGRPTTRDEQITAFRLVAMRTGSAILTLEPEKPVDDGGLVDQDQTVAIANLDAFLDALQSDEPVDPEVASSVASARRALGPDGRIGVKRRKRRKIVIDEEVERNLVARARKRGPRSMTLSGRLHLIDLEPDRIGIRAADGVEWSCRYPPDLEPVVKSLLDSNVWARGQGEIIGALRGSMDIVDLQAIGIAEQSTLFTFERVPLPLDLETLERWAELRAACLRSGHTGPGDNDLWIAAAAIERGLPLVTCDGPQARIPGLSNVIYLEPAT